MTAARTATALQLAVLDGRQADIALLLNDLDAGQLRDVIRELAAIWHDAVRWNYSRAEMRAAIAADALDQAADTNLGG